jgi:hypothetical protein
MPTPKTLHRRQTPRRQINPPEELTDDSPLIRNSHITEKVIGVSEKTIREIVHELAASTKVAKKLPTDRCTESEHIA